MSEQRAQEQVQVQAAQDRFQDVMDAGRARAQQDRSNCRPSCTRASAWRSSASSPAGSPTTSTTCSR